MKKNILFVIDSLACGGAEKSLVTLLNLFDYTQYNVDLQLFGYEGEFMPFVPKQVTILPPLTNAEAWKDSRKNKMKAMLARWRYSTMLRLKKVTSPNDAFQLYWESYKKCYTITEKEYDTAIAYGQRLPTAYVATKVKAARKLAWINIIPQWQGKMRDYMMQFYDVFDHIVTVSDASFAATSEMYPQYANKLTIVHDIVSLRFIQHLAEEECEHAIDTSVPMLLTVARLDYVCKGYDIALETAKILKERGVRFKWYALGKGAYYDQMKAYIAEHHLEDKFILLGAIPNPYPYFKACTLYVQTSRYEGYGISIAEARLLNRPIVTTEFSAVYTQMVEGKNGIVTPQDPIAVADAIEELLNHNDLYKSIVDYQMHEKKGNEEEIEKIYQLMASHC